MLLILCQVSLSVLLFVLLFVTFRHLAIAVAGIHAVRSRLTWEKKASQPLLGGRLAPLHRHLGDLVEVTRLVPTIGAFLTLTLILSLGGITAGVLVFQSAKGVLALLTVAGMLPYVLLRLQLISRQMRIRLEFLPAAEVFYQQIMLEVRPNIRSTLQAVVAGDRLLYPVKSSFEQLQRNLTTGRETADALRVFKLEHGHVWADYFVNMFQIAIEDGVDIGPSLKELIEDMRRAQLYDQKARNRLLEIRLASFSPLFFLLLFAGVNLKLNYDNSIRFYLYTADGRSMLLNAILLIFGSFLMGIYLSMKRM